MMCPECKREVKKAYAGLCPKCDAARAERECPRAPTNLETIPGSLASGYRATIVSVDLLMRELNRIATEGNLLPDKKLDSAITGIMVALKLGLMHFPSLQLKVAVEIPENPCPMCNRPLEDQVLVRGSHQAGILQGEKMSIPIVDIMTGKTPQKRVIAIAVEGSQKEVSFLLEQLTFAFAPNLRFTSGPAEEAVGSHGRGQIAVYAEGPTGQIDEAEAWAQGFLAALRLL